jgi:hypothetical protein
LGAQNEVNTFISYQMEELWNREDEVDDLRDEKKQHRLGEVTQYPSLQTHNTVTPARYFQIG